ncbi:MAG: response regulator, partial [Thermoanaerobaculia bacterium]|nr:response regulator [Thermoanaerobaculia bacterium]
AALEQARENRYGWIFLDLEMPGMNGFDTLEALHERDTIRSDATIVALSAHRDDSIRRRAVEAGFDLYVEKPLDTELLGDVFRDQVRENRGATADGEVAVEIDDDLRGVLPAFLANKRADLRELRNAFEQGDGESARSLSHKLRGAFSVYGLDRARDHCRELEAAAASGQTDRVREIIEVIEADLDRISRDLA